MKKQIPMSESMTRKIYTVDSEKPIFEAFEFLRECRVRHLVVLDSFRHVVGVISDRDFQRAMVSRVERSGGVRIIGEEFDPTHLVKDFMSWGVETMTEKEGVKVAALKMLELKISSLVVVNEAHKMVGFITSDDLLWILVKLLDEDQGDFLKDLTAQIMTSPLGSLVNSLSQAGI